MLLWTLCIVGAYLVGSIPIGVLIGRAKGVDIREHGSKNVGATNVGRVLGRPLGVACFFLDLLKGGVPVVAAGLACNVINREPKDLTQMEMWLWLAVAVAAVVGHMASIFLRFAGGKGVATTFGALLAMWPLLTLPAIGGMVVWYAVLRLSRYVSLSSMLAAVSMPVWYAVRAIPNSGEDVLAQLIHASPPLIVTALIAVLVIWRHRENIGRLRRGEEPKSGETARVG